MNYDLASICLKGEKNDHPLSMADGVIAATALDQSMVVTRNIKDFQDLGIELFNPWYILFNHELCKSCYLGAPRKLSEACKWKEVCYVNSPIEHVVKRTAVEVTKSIEALWRKKFGLMMKWV